jgi:hypothetical protein
VQFTNCELHFLSILKLLYHKYNNPRESALQKKTKSILDELDSLLAHRDREKLLESRANHIIQGAINLINTIRENYDSETAKELENRLINSIKAQDSTKFARGVRRVNKNENQ